jgi:hypothetical protein
LIEEKRANTQVRPYLSAFISVNLRLKTTNFLKGSIMQGKFDGVPVDEDTKILAQLETNLGNYRVLYQKWFWDGITAESIIFDSQDVANLTDDEILAEVKESPLVAKDSKTTISRSESGFTFVNFNFVVG